jgi:GNAT superfamily N-acetyltransferase
VGRVYDRDMTVLREPRTDEAAALAELQEVASVAALPHVFPPERYPYPREAIRARWVRALEDLGSRVVVAELDGVMVGVAFVRDEWLHGLYVLPERWGTRVAAMLHDRALELVRELGSARCHLWVLEENVRARKFYERRGWRENGRTRIVSYPPNPLDVGYTLDF